MKDGSEDVLYPKDWDRPPVSDVTECFFLNTKRDVFMNLTK